MIPGTGLRYTIRKHWKKSALGFCAYCYGLTYASQRYKDYLTRREYFQRARVFSERPCLPLEKPRRFYVLLNPEANRAGSLKLFEKNVAPLFHLAGVDTTFIQMDYEGHGKTIMNYVDHTVAGVVIAGGDGSVSEIVTGLLRRPEGERDIPIGVIPLGQLSNSLFHKLFGWSAERRQVRDICRAVLAVLEGGIRQVDVMEVRAGEKSVFALNSLHIGAHGVARNNITKGRFWWFARWKREFAFVWQTKRWPNICRLRVTTTNADMSKQSLLNDSALDTDAPSTNGCDEQAVDSVDLEAAGISVYLQPKTDNKSARLALQSWPITMDREMFVRTGCDWLYRNFSFGQSNALETTEHSSICLEPLEGGDEFTYSIDGETFEAKAIDLLLREGHINVFSPAT